MVPWVVGSIVHGGARCRSVIRAFAHGAVGRRIDPSWWSEMSLRGKSVRSRCDGSSDRSFMVERDVAHGAMGRVLQQLALNEHHKT